MTYSQSTTPLYPLALSKLNSIHYKQTRDRYAFALSFIEWLALHNFTFISLVTLRSSRIVSQKKSFAGCYQQRLNHMSFYILLVRIRDYTFCSLIYIIINYSEFVPPPRLVCRILRYSQINLEILTLKKLLAVPPMHYDAINLAES